MEPPPRTDDLRVVHAATHCCPARLRAQTAHMGETPMPDRSRPPHFPGVSHGSRASLFFVTVCTKDRQPLLATTSAHDTLLEAWAHGTTYRVGRYVLMPDHVHLFCAPAVWPPESLVSWVRFWKSWAARHWPERCAKLWQRDFWDTQIRRGESYTEKCEYIRRNPVRAGLVAESEAWPYQGEVHSLAWHD